MCRISNKIIGYHSISLDIIGLFCRVSDNIIHDIQCLTKFTATKTSKCSCRCSSKSPCSAGTRPKTKLANLSDQIWEFSTPSAPYGNSISLFHSSSSGAVKSESLIFIYCICSNQHQSILKTQTTSIPKPTMQTQTHPTELQASTR